MEITDISAPADYVNRGGIQAKKYVYLFAVMAGLFFVILFYRENGKTETVSESVILNDRNEKFIFPEKNTVTVMGNQKLFEELWQKNEETVAFIKIPGTDIDYPVVQADNNEKYLKINFEGEESAAGAIYLDCDCDRSLENQQVIFYGHHMRDGSMFAKIDDFKDESFFRKHREIILFLPEKTVRLKTIAAVVCSAEGERRKTRFDSGEELEGYMEDMTVNCPFRELPEGKIDRLYSFVTCSYEFENARTILYAAREDLW